MSIVRISIAIASFYALVNIVTLLQNCINARKNSGEMQVAGEQKEGSKKEERDEDATSTKEVFECCICMETHEHRVKDIFECTHEWNQDCINEWLVSKVTCPLCRAQLRIRPMTEREEADWIHLSFRPIRTYPVHLLDPDTVERIAQFERTERQVAASISVLGSRIEELSRLLP